VVALVLVVLLLQVVTLCVEHFVLISALFSIMQLQTLANIALMQTRIRQCFCACLQSKAKSGTPYRHSSRDIEAGVSTAAVHSSALQSSTTAAASMAISTVNNSAVTSTGINAATTAGQQALRPGFCRKCRAVKPVRAHHCSVSKQCVLNVSAAVTHSTHTAESL
jgi:ribosomal protein L40E